MMRRLGKIVSLGVAACACMATASGGVSSPRTCSLNLLGTSPPYPVANTISPAPPPALPSESSLFDFLFVLQRHGARAPVTGTELFPVGETAVHGGQLTPQGAHELHVSGEEVREYLFSTVSETCRRKGKQSASHHSHHLTGCGANSLSPGRMFVRTTAVPRTQWSALAFVEGFFKLPYGCIVSPEDLSQETGHARPTRMCVRATMSLDVEETFGRGNVNTGQAPKGPAGSRSLRGSSDAVGGTSPGPKGDADETARLTEFLCLHAPHLQRDGIMAGMPESQSSEEVRRKLASEAGRDPFWIPTSRRTTRALRVIAEAFPETEKLGSFKWLLWDRFLAERAAVGEGPMTPSMRRLYEWVLSRQLRTLASEEKTLGAQTRTESLSPGVEAGEGVTSADETYEALLKDIEHVFGVGFRFMHGTPEYAPFSASGLILLANGMLRVKAYGRLEDFENLQRVVGLLGGFDELVSTKGRSDKPAEAVEGGLETLKRRAKELEVMLFSGHDIMIMSLLWALGVSDEALLPFGGKVYIELTSAPATEALDYRDILTGRRQKQNKAEPPLLDVGSLSWPETGHSVRVLVGKPGQAMRVVALPFCAVGEAACTTCPLLVWLSRTYALIDGSALHQMASSFRDIWKTIVSKTDSL